MKRHTVDAAVRMGHCDHVSASELVALWDRAESANAELERLRVLNRGLGLEATDARSNLAAANELLDECANGSRAPNLTARCLAFLAAQPAALRPAGITDLVRWALAESLEEMECGATEDYLLASLARRGVKLVDVDDQPESKGYPSCGEPSGHKQLCPVRIARSEGSE